MPEELEDKLHEAVYKSAEQKDYAVSLTFFERVDNASPALGHIARGRYALYQGNLEEAKAQTGQCRKR